jgi:hypothetical protein
MPDFQIICFGGCGKVQALTNDAKSAEKNRLFCPDCASLQPKPKPVVSKADEIMGALAEIKDSGVVTPESIEKIIVLMIR